MFIGYARVSKSDGSQNLDLQKDALKEVGVQEERIYEDVATGSHSNRNGLTFFKKPKKVRSFVMSPNL